MPRLPDLDSLGSRPTPVSRRAIATVRNAGAVADAAGSLGDQLARTGNQMLEKQDRMAYAAAKTALISADVKTRAELQNDPDYATYDKRYDAAMLTARQSAAKLIQSKSDRSLFEQDAGTDIERGRAQVQTLATTKRVVARKAVLNDGLETLRDTGRHATDDETHFQIVHTASELINGAEKSGDLDPLEASNLRRSWPAEYVGERVQGKITDEDYEGAQAYLNKHRDLVDWKQGDEFERSIKKGLDYRTSISDAQSAVGITAGQEGPATAYQDPLRGRGTGVVAGGQFAAQRGAKTHNGVDFTAPVGTPIYSVGQGVVSKVGHDDRSGNFVIIDHGGGRTSSYAHLAGFNVKEGEEVTPDTKLGAVGMTGHTTGPHLHMVVRDGDKVVDPTKVIGQAQQSPRVHDLNQVYASIDAKADREGWTVERRERAKGQADLLVKRDEGLLNRAQDEAMKSALDKVDRLADNFTDLGQLGNIPGLSARDRITLRNIADSNKKSTAPEANSETVAGLHQLAIYNPDGFKNLDLRTVRNQVTPAEYDSLGTLQATMRTSNTAPVVVQHEAVWTMINRYAPDIGLKTGKDAKPADRQRAQKLFDAVKGDLDAHVSKDGRAPTDDEVKAAFDRQTIKLVQLDSGGLFSGPKEVSRFEFPQGAKAGVSIPDRIRKTIVDSYRRAHGGAAPSEPQIAAAYVDNKGRLW